MKTTPIQVLILGGGYVSVLAYRSMAKKLRQELSRGDVQITVVSPLTHHTFHGWTAETLTGVLQIDNQLSPLDELMPHAKLIIGRALALNAPSNTVQIQLADGREQYLTYDHLLLGIGTADSLAIEGSREFGFQVKDRDSFHRTHTALYQLVQRAAQLSPQKAQRLLRVNLAGGGFTGVELATNLMEYLKLLMKEHPTLRYINPTVRLIHTSDHVMASFLTSHQRLVNCAEQTIDQYGIERVPNRRLVRITNSGAQLDDGTFLESTMTITTVGQQRIELGGMETFKRDAQGRLVTNSYQQLLNHLNVWGGGDACHVPCAGRQEACPANALWAIKHGEYVGRNISRAIKQQALKPFDFRGLGEAASLGVGKGIGELYGIQFTGRLAWVLRLLFFHYFLPSRRVMWESIKDWTYLFTKGKRIGLEKLKQTSLLRSPHFAQQTVGRVK